MVLRPPMQWKGPKSARKDHHKWHLSTYMFSNKWNGKILVCRWWRNLHDTQIREAFHIFFAHMYQQSVAYAFTICRICGIFTVTLIWIVLNYLQLLSCPVVSIISIHVCMVLLTWTSQGFKCVQNQLARLVTKSPPFTRSLPLLRSLHWLPVPFRILFKINLLTCKSLHEKHPVYLHYMLATSLPSRSLRLNNNNSLSVPRVKTNTGARAFHSCVPSLWNNLPVSFRFSHFSCYLSETSEDTSLWLGFSPIDAVTPHGLLMLQNCFLDFAVEHWFGCRATEPGFAGDIGAIEVLLIAWLISHVTGGGGGSDPLAFFIFGCCNRLMHLKWSLLAILNRWHHCQWL